MREHNKLDVLGSGPHTCVYCFLAGEWMAPQNLCFLSVLRSQGRVQVFRVGETAEGYQYQQKGGITQFLMCNFSTSFKIVLTIYFV